MIRKNSEGNIHGYQFPYLLGIQHREELKRRPSVEEVLLPTYLFSLYCSLSALNVMKSQRQSLNGYINSSASLTSLATRTGAISGRTEEKERSRERR